MSEIKENEQSAIGGVSNRCCALCKNFKYKSPQLDQPYPEYWCSKGHWSGLDNVEEYIKLKDDVECDDFQ